MRPRRFFLDLGWLLYIHLDSRQDKWRRVYLQGLLALEKNEKRPFLLKIYDKFKYRNRLEYRYLIYLIEKGSPSAEFEDLTENFLASTAVDFFYACFLQSQGASVELGVELLENLYSLPSLKKEELEILQDMAVIQGLAKDLPKNPGCWAIRSVYRTSIAPE